MIRLRDSMFLIELNLTELEDSIFLGHPRPQVSCYQTHSLPFRANISTSCQGLAAAIHEPAHISVYHVLFTQPLHAHFATSLLLREPSASFILDHASSQEVSYCPTLSHVGSSPRLF